MAQHRIAGDVAVAVVDMLEVVGVDDDQRDRARRLAPAQQFQFGGVEEGAAIGQAGEVVAGDRFVQRLAGFAAVRDVANDQAVAALFRPRLAGCMQRGDQAATPVAAAVGARAPAFFQAPPGAIGVVQPVQRALPGDGVSRVEQRARLPDGLRCIEAGDALDAGVPVQDLAAAVQGHQRVVGQAGDDGAEPSLAVPQFAVALDRFGDVAQHGHEALVVELEQRERENFLCCVAPSACAGHEQLHGVADHAVAVRHGSRAVPQVGCQLGQRGKEVVELAVARKWHQQLRAQRVDHHDFAIQARLHQADWRQVEELQQRLVLFFGSGVHPVHLKPAGRRPRSASLRRLRPTGAA